MTEKRTGEQDGAYWVNTVSLEHVQAGVGGGFTQADHGRATRLRRLRPGDGLVFHSPRTAMRGGQPVQEFTALGRITGLGLPFPPRPFRDRPRGFPAVFRSVGNRLGRPLQRPLGLTSRA